MKCPKCSAELRKVNVKVEGASSKAVSLQCPKCDYFSFDAGSSAKVLQELHDSPLKIKQKVVGLSADRLGIYLNSNIVRSLNIKKGNEVLYISNLTDSS